MKKNNCNELTKITISEIKAKEEEVMTISDTIKSMENLLEQILHDLVKAGRGNRTASQRVRTNTIKLAKVAKVYRKESIAEEKGKKKKGKSMKKRRKKAAPKKAAAPKKRRRKSTAKKSTAKRKTTKRKSTAKRKNYKKKDY